MSASDSRKVRRLQTRATRLAVVAFIGTSSDSAPSVGNHTMSESKGNPFITVAQSSAQYYEAEVTDDGDRADQKDHRVGAQVTRLTTAQSLGAQPHQPCGAVDQAVDTERIDHSGQETRQGAERPNEGACIRIGAPGCLETLEENAQPWLQRVFEGLTPGVPGVDEIGHIERAERE